MNECSNATRQKMKTQGKQLIRIRGDVGYSGVVNAHR